MMQVDLSELPAALADELVRGRHARDTMTALRAPENQLRVYRLRLVQKLKVFVMSRQNPAGANTL